MHVLHVVPNLRIGGPAHVVPELCARLEGEGISTALCGLGRPFEQAAQVAWLPSLRGSSTLPAPGFAAAVRPHVLKSDLVHLHGLWSPAIAMTAAMCRRVRRPYVITLHGMIERTGLRRHRIRKRLYGSLIERRTLAGAAAAHFLTPLELTRSRLDGLERVPRVVIPNGIDRRWAAEIAGGRFVDRYPQLAGKRIVLTVGRLNPGKGLPLQARAIALLAESYADLHWVVIGPDQGEWGPLEALAERLGIGDRLLWTGTLPRATCLAALKDADVYLQTSLHEAQSLATLEALAVGCPTVLARPVADPDLVAAGACLSADRDPADVAAAVASILREPAVADGLRAAASQFVAERLTWDAVVPEFVRLYRDVREGQGLGSVRGTWR